MSLIIALIRDINMPRKSSQSIINIIKKRIYSHGRGWCFTLSNFIDLKNHEAVKKALQRLVKSGVIHRASRGIYYYPEVHKILGLIPPSLEKTIKAICDRDQIKVQETGAYATNALGFCTQVPAKVVYLTNGPSKKIKVSNRDITFRKTSAKNMANAGTYLGVLIQAMKFIGKDGFSKRKIHVLKSHVNKLTEKDLKGLKFAPAWIQEAIIEIQKGKRPKIQNDDILEEGNCN